jgi:hypothetical protein
MQEEGSNTSSDGSEIEFITDEQQRILFETDHNALMEIQRDLMM